ncbi:ABC transporter ATP-binding protein [uncultured Microscilla sp.]|uniref:ABC transporter ATP-binding protein n=1 Tax=uncultured Microscilla sp. TaxID=432653 RepID=UPI002638880A|nr:ABC transporter ATP-binding protein [uncultured Microscilla sp.]
MEEVIKTQGITKVYNETKGVPVYALNGVDLTIKKGEFTAVVGPSGSGKSTLLNIIGGLDSPTAGVLEVGGTDISKLKESKLIDFRLNNIGFVFQAYNLIPVLTAKENVAFIMQLQKRPKKEVDQRASELLAEVGLGDRFNNRPSELSGGQQQRVAVARALASKPQFVLADEPTANLDSKSAENLLDIMAKLNREENITFVFSTHDPRVINRAHRVVTLEDGKVVKDEYKQEMVV